MRLATDAFDLIISDMDMPKLDGMRMLELLRKNAVATPLVFLTADVSPQDEARALAAGALDYIHKPVDKDTLSQRVTEVLSRIAGGEEMHG